MKTSSKIIAWVAGGASIAMFVGSFAAEPLYSTFCKVTGFGGTTQVAKEAPKTILDRVVRVHFDTNVDKSAPFTFKPTQPYLDIKLGEKILTFFEVTNNSKSPVRGMATFNVAPHKAGPYFDKLECFCFKEKLFQPGVTERLPVVFFVSPDMAKDATADDVKGITLSYTYFRSQQPQTATARLEDASKLN